MSWADVKKHFTDLEITNVSIDPLHEDEAGQRLKCKGNPGGKARVFTH